MKNELHMLTLLCVFSLGVFAENAHASFLGFGTSSSPYFSSGNSSSASDRGFYVSLAGGNSGSATLDAQSSVVDTSSSGSAYFGYQLRPSIAIQGGYSVLFNGANVSLKNAVVGSTTISGMEFNVLLSRPIYSRIFPYLLVGKAVMTETDTLLAGGTQTVVSFAGLTYGAGLRIDMGAHWGVQLGYTLYDLKDYYGFSLPLNNSYLALRYMF